MDLNMNAPIEDGADLTPGVTLARVGQVDEKASQTGTPMLNLKLIRDDGRRLLCYDNIMLGGKGWAIGHPKLVALGVDENHEGPFDPQTLHGRRVWVETKIDEYQGKRRLAVNIDGLTHKGYQHVDNTPVGQDPAGEDIDTPF